MKRWLFLLLGVLFCVGLLGMVSFSVNAKDSDYSAQATASPMSLLVPTWTRSYQLYGQPHAIWLSQYQAVGSNLPKLKQVISEAEKQGKRFEVVIYSIPFRDMGQSSGGGFDTFKNYFKDNRLNAKAIGGFVKRTGIRPRVYLEPDALAHAIQYRADHHDNPDSIRVYDERVRAIRRLVALYKKQGALVYLDAAHSNWFDYSDKQVQSMAQVLNRSGIAQADGLISNVSNRQKIAIREGERTEEHYLQRLLPRLRPKKNFKKFKKFKSSKKSRALDIIVDTSRNGGETRQRRYQLTPAHELMDNETPEKRLVGRWYTDDDGERWVVPFFGEPMKISILTRFDKYTFSETSMTLSAPPWLDAVGDVQLGASPTNHTGIPLIHKFRHIKPPDDCDGSLNCPPGWSKHDLNQKTHQQAGFN